MRKGFIFLDGQAATWKEILNFTKSQQLFTGSLFTGPNPDTNIPTNAEYSQYQSMAAM